MAEAKVFVTVGTTNFDLLISTLLRKENIETLKNRGYKKCLLQIGSGSTVPKTNECDGIEISYYRYKDSIADDIKDASLVISHAGAGTCLEVLGAGKPLVVVINEELMDNHQTELAEQLFKDGHVLYCTCSALTEVLQSMDVSKLKPFPPGHSENFARILNNILDLNK